MKAAVLILNWNGRELLERNLPVVIRQTPPGADVYVVDNGSTDGSAAWVRASCPAVHLVQLDRNYGFAGGYNRAIPAVDCDIVVLLNSDIRPAAGYLEALLAPFSDDELFATTARIRMLGEECETGLTSGEFRDGLLRLNHARDERARQREVLYAGGSASAFRRDRMLALGLFDEEYRPFYWEDVDLSYRAWRCGWKTVFVPGAVVWHERRASVRKCGHAEPGLQHILRKNACVFFWKNISDENMRREHEERLRQWLAGTGDPADVAAAQAAAREFPRASRPGPEPGKLTDRQILARTAGNAEAPMKRDDWLPAEQDTCTAEQTRQLLLDKLRAAATAYEQLTADLHDCRSALLERERACGELERAQAAERERQAAAAAAEIGRRDLTIGELQGEIDRLRREETRLQDECDAFRKRVDAYRHTLAYRCYCRVRKLLGG